jgi:PhnB protein
MPSILNPYINFNGDARAAIEFYKTVFGGKLTVSTYKEGGMPHEPGEENKLMHAMLATDNNITLMAADIPNGIKHNPGTNVKISLSGDDGAELTSYWEKISAGAKINQPLVKAPWGDTFGMLTDKFGIDWMVNILGKKQ